MILLQEHGWRVCWVYWRLLWLWVGAETLAEDREFRLLLLRFTLEHVDPLGLRAH